MIDIGRDKLVDAAHALVSVLNGSTRASPLGIFAYPKYPERELSPQELPDGSILLRLYKWGWNYKFRGYRPSHIPPPADIEGISRYLRSHPLFPYDVVTVEDCSSHITIIIKEEICNEREHQ